MIKKIRFIEPGNYLPFKDSPRNYFTYNKSIRNPSTGLITLATIMKKRIRDTLMYSEAISKIDFDDVLDADIVFLSINTFNAVRGYEICRKIHERSQALVVLGGLHASLNYSEAVQHADYVLRGDGDELILEFVNAVDEGLPIDFKGVVFRQDGEIVNTGEREPPEDIDTVPDRSLVHDYARLASRYDTLWPQVHASRGCPHNCDYCALVHHFGRKVRTRSPQSVVEDIRQAIAFHRRSVPPRLNTAVWITDDNFASDREWAKSVLNEIIESGIKSDFSVQARAEIGFDDELLSLMKKAGFFEVTLGIEFLDDESFKRYNKKSKRADIERAISNIKAHGMGVRGLFIVGADDHQPGIGNRIARFVIDNDIHGILVQSLFFTPGTPFYDEHEDRLIHKDWNRYDGKVVHYPEHMSPARLEEEIIVASRRSYSKRRLLRAMVKYPWLNKVLFFGEYLWHRSQRKELKKELGFLRKL